MSHSYHFTTAIAALCAPIYLQAICLQAQVASPPEFNRPPVVIPHHAATTEEKSSWESLLKIDFKDKPVAIIAVTNYIAQHPDSGAGYSLRAYLVGCETSSPDLEKASADAQRALQLPKDNFGFADLATPIAAKAALRLNRPKEAIKLLADALIKNPDDIKNLLGSNSGKVEQSDPSLCGWGLADFDAMNSALTKDWRIPLIRGAYYGALFNLTDDALFAKAETYYREAALLNPRSPIPSYLIGETETKRLLFKQDSERRTVALRAASAYSDAIRIDPTFTLAYLGRAEAYLEAKEDAMAIRDFTTVLGREPDNSTAVADRGNAYSETHDYYRAISDFGDAIRLETESGSSYLKELFESRGDAYVAVHNDGAAVNDYTDAIWLDVKSQLMLLSLGQVRALYPEYGAQSDSALLHVLHERFAVDEDEAQFSKDMTSPRSEWTVSFLLSNLFEKRGETYIRLKNFPSGLADFQRIYRGVSNMASSLERWRSVGFGGYLMDVKTSTAGGRLATLWVKKIQKSGSDVVTSFSINCENRKIMQESAYTYDQEGNVKRSEGEGNWDYIIPDTFGEYLWESSCNNMYK